MTTISGRYLPGKKVELRHEDSGALIVTSAPKDNNGDGSSFSPTDLLAASLGACMLTVIGILAERKGIDVSGMEMTVGKEMAASPRRVAALPVVIHLPQRLSAEERALCEAAARACPVHHSIHPYIRADVTFVYDRS